MGDGRVLGDLTDIGAHFDELCTPTAVTTTSVNTVITTTAEKAIRAAGGMNQVSRAKLLDPHPQINRAKTPFLI